MNASGDGSDLRLMHMNAWVVRPQQVLLTYTYFFKCRCAPALRPWLDGRTLEEKEKGTRDAMDARQVAVQQNAAQGRRRIKAATRLRHVPRNPEPLNEWTRAALLEIATGTAPCWKGSGFPAYLHRLARHLWRKAHEGKRKIHRTARLARLAKGRAALRARELRLRTARSERQQARQVAAQSLSRATVGVPGTSVRSSADGLLRVLTCGTCPVGTTHPSRGRHGLARARAPPGCP